MICAIMQPTYLPWAGGFDLLDQVDVFAFYDDVQVVRRSWDVRNRIKTANGELFLTIPIRKTSHRDETVFTTALIDDSRSWRKEHLAAIGHSYRKAVHFDEVFAFVEALIQVDLGVLADFNIHLITSIARRMGMTADLVRVSSLPECAGRKDARLVNICRRLSADAYLSPFGAHAYIEREARSRGVVSRWRTNSTSPCRTPNCMARLPPTCVYSICCSTSVSNGARK